MSITTCTIIKMYIIMHVSRNVCVCVCLCACVCTQDCQNALQEYQPRTPSNAGWHSGMPGIPGKPANSNPIESNRLRHHSLMNRVESAAARASNANHRTTSLPNWRNALQSSNRIGGALAGRRIESNRTGALRHHNRIESAASR